MCIICNLRNPASDVYAASDFLTAYRTSQEAMEAATKAMLAVTKLDLQPEDRKRYDRVHKQMKRLMRDWNMIEHTREIEEVSASPSDTPPSPCKPAQSSDTASRPQH